MSLGEKDLDKIFSTYEISDSGLDDETRQNEKKEKHKNRRLERERNSDLLNASVIAEATGTKPVKEIVDNEGEKRQEKLTYLANNLVEDMKTFYGAKDVDKKEATERLESFGVKTIPRADGGKNYIAGNQFANKLNEFLERDKGFPDNWWPFFGENLKAIGIDIGDLQEARKVKQQGGQEDVAPDTTKIETAQEMSFDEKRQLLENGGGAQVEQFLKYIKGEVYDGDMDKIKGDLTKAFGFDVNVLAEEWKERNKKTERSSVDVKTEHVGISDWAGRLSDPFLQELVILADPIKWQENIKKIEGLDDTKREEELLILRALIKIKREGLISPEARNLWDKHKSRLAELGLVV